jgi:hypothetical protein
MALCKGRADQRWGGDRNHCSREPKSTGKKWMKPISLSIHRPSRDFSPVGAFTHRVKMRNRAKAHIDWPKPAILTSLSVDSGEKYKGIISPVSTRPRRRNPHLTPMSAMCKPFPALLILPASLCSGEPLAGGLRFFRARTEDHHASTSIS